MRLFVLACACAWSISSLLVSNARVLPRARVSNASVSTTAIAMALLKEIRAYCEYVNISTARNLKEGIQKNAVQEILQRMKCVRKPPINEISEIAGTISKSAFTDELKEVLYKALDELQGVLPMAASEARVPVAAPKTAPREARVPVAAPKTAPRTPSPDRRLPPPPTSLASSASGLHVELTKSQTHNHFEFYLTEDNWRLQLDPKASVDLKVEELAEVAALIGLLNPKESTSGSIVSIALNNWLMTDVHSDKGLEKVDLFKQCLSARESYGVPGAPKTYTTNPDSLPEVFKNRAYGNAQPIVSRLRPGHLAGIRAKLPVRKSAKCTHGLGGQGQSSMLQWTPAISMPTAAAGSALAAPGRDALARQPQEVFAVLGQALATAEPSLYAAAADPNVQAMLKDKGQAKSLWKAFLQQQNSPTRRDDSITIESPGEGASPKANEKLKRAMTCNSQEDSLLSDKTESALGTATPKAGQDKPATPKARRPKGAAVEDLLDDFTKGADDDQEETDDDCDDDDEPAEPAHQEAFI